MREKKYPGLQEHVAQHAAFVKLFQDVVRQFDTKGASITVTLSLQKLISGWLVQHVGNVDTKLASFLAGQSVSMST